MYSVPAVLDSFPILRRIIDEKRTHDFECVLVADKDYRDYQYSHLEVFHAEMVSLEIINYI